MDFDFTNLRPFLTCKDHTVSGEKFELLYNSEYDLLITSPKPNAEKLPEYYKSENYISHTDSKKSAFDKIYQWVKSIMLQKKMKLLEKYHPQKGTLLDIGTGTGDFLKTAKAWNWEIHGTEPNQKAHEIAQGKGVALKTETTVFPGEKFDVISMWHVLEHVPDLEKQLKEINRLLKKDGTLIIAVPNFKSFDAKHYGEFWAAYDAPRHLWHFSKTSIAKLFESVDFEIMEIVPLKFDAYYVSSLSEKYKTGKSNFPKTFWIGFLSNWKAISSKEHSSHIYVLKRQESRI